MNKHANDIKVQATVIDADTIRYGGSAFMRERVCHVMVGVGGWFCSECSVFVNNDCIADAQRWIAPSFCPNCGAKVVSE